MPWAPVLGFVSSGLEPNAAAQHLLLPALVLMLIKSCLAGERSSRCRPQGLLKLDRPYQKPSQSEILFPFCQQYQHCSCCNASHVVAVERSLQTVDSSALSASCGAMTAQLACSICDPEIGTAQKQHICAATCQQWYKRCQHDYFSYSPFSQHLVPCGTKQASEVCSQVSELTDNGQSFCQQAGYDVREPNADSSNGGCFDGTISASTNFASCSAPVRRQQQKVKPGSRFPLLYFMVLLSAAAAVVLVYRRLAFLMTRRKLCSPATRSSNPQFPGSGRRLCD
ncbi:hypothetical protein ABBQ38_006108 [Trebouxia sp. C0009 RCD-2024]